MDKSKVRLDWNFVQQKVVDASKIYYCTRDKQDQSQLRKVTTKRG